MALALGAVAIITVFFVVIKRRRKWFRSGQETTEFRLDLYRESLVAFEVAPHHRVGLEGKFTSADTICSTDNGPSVFARLNMCNTTSNGGDCDGEQV